MATTFVSIGPASWMSDGACRDEDPELFFPLSEHGASADQIHRATSICHGCHVESVCLRYSLVNGIKDGIWGGRTEQQRVGMIRNRTDNRARERQSR